MQMKLIAAAVLTVGLVGSANPTQQHFDPDAAKSTTSKTAPANSEQSTVYSIREWTLRQSFLPLVYCTVVAVMGSTKPLGAYVPLTREPGSRKNKVKGGTF